MVVPQGQDVIPRRPRGGASCIGCNSANASWWRLIARIKFHCQIVVPHFTYLDCQVLESQMIGWSMGECLLFVCLTLKLHVECYDIRFLYTSLPFCLLVCCVWFSLLRWSSISLMWAVVRIPGTGNDSRDAAAWWILDEYRAHFGAHSYWSFSSLSFSRFWRDSVSCFRPCGASFFCYGYVWGTVYFISQIFALFGYLCMWHFIKLELSI